MDRADTSGIAAANGASDGWNPKGEEKRDSDTSSGIERNEYGATGPARNKSTATQGSTVAALLKNPLTGMSEADVIADVDRFVDEKGLREHREAFRTGALLARVGQRPDGFEQLDSITDDQKEKLRHEIAHRWSQPFMLYFLVVLCAGSAIVQGMDQTAVNGAQVSWRAMHVTCIVEC